ncbi:hypothetical protein [Fodinibius roseus]|uniref:hypothetical protein n=1 Tax=Fodinibius roseus TaxID=1194090 RepID=UPI001114A40D|nr:hypothetical protein [Fodinibius roseus]
MELGFTSGDVAGEHDTLISLIAGIYYYFSEVVRKRSWMDYRLWVAQQRGREALAGNSEAARSNRE